MMGESPPLQTVASPSSASQGSSEVIPQPSNWKALSIESQWLNDVNHAMPLALIDRAKSIVEPPTPSTLAVGTSSYRSLEGTDLVDTQTGSWSSTTAQGQWGDCGVNPWSCPVKLSGRVGYGSWLQNAWSPVMDWDFWVLSWQSDKE
jgi:hypothetical protein